MVRALLSIVNANKGQGVTMTTAADDHLLTTAEVAKRLRRSESTMRYWRMIHFGPANFSIGRKVVYRAGDVEAWIAEQRRESGSGDAA
jgi:predicted DNA-binding transcriptional regulator AlpA